MDPIHLIGIGGQILLVMLQLGRIHRQLERIADELAKIAAKEPTR
jgi:hypothetical protein